MSTDEKETDIVKGKTNKKADRFSVTETQENARDIGEWCLSIQGFAE